MLSHRRLTIPIVIALISFIGFSAYCYGTSDCNTNASPNCYKLTFSGIEKCDPNDDDPPDGIYYLSGGGEGGNGLWKTSTGVCDPNGFKFELIITNSNTFVETKGKPCFKYEGKEAVEGSGDNMIENQDDCEELQCGTCKDGSVSWEPCKDCGAADNKDPNNPQKTSTADNCCDCLCEDVKLSSPNDITVYFSNLDCCPATNDSGTVVVTMSCDKAKYVTAHGPDGGVIKNSRLGNLANVTVSPEGNCKPGSSVTFTITPLQGRTNDGTSYSCEAVFYDQTKKNKQEGHVTVTLEPRMSDCCIGGNNKPTTVP